MLVVKWRLPGLEVQTFVRQNRSISLLQSCRICSSQCKRGSWSVVE